jgi:hypothetical protein
MLTLWVFILSFNAFEYSVVQHIFSPFIGVAASCRLMGVLPLPVCVAPD